MGLLVIVFAGAIIVLSMTVRGAVLSQLWYWFMVPFGLPNISIAWALGITLVVSMLTEAYSHTKNDADEHWTTRLFAAFATPLLFLTIGYIVHSFM